MVATELNPCNERGFCTQCTIINKGGREIREGGREREGGRGGGGGGGGEKEGGRGEGGGRREGRREEDVRRWVGEKEVEHWGGKRSKPWGHSFNSIPTFPPFAVFFRPYARLA